MRKIKVFVLFILLLLSTIPQVYSLHSVHKSDTRNSSKISFGKTNLLNTLVTFKNDEVIKELESKLGQKIVSFYPIPIIFIRSQLNNEEIKMLEQYIDLITSINKIRTIKLPESNIGDNPIEPLSNSTITTINATILHKNGINGEGVRIAVIDTGIWHHPDFADRIIAEKSFIRKIYGYPVDSDNTDDKIGHGTSVAGVAAGDGSKDPRYIGVAPNASIINAKVFYGESSQEAMATDAGIIAAIRWCVLEANADIINLSIGAPARLSDPLVTAVDWAVKHGVIVVVAAGNEGDGGKGSMQISTPGVSKYVITVGASGPAGNFIESYTSIGPIYDMSVKPDVLAPGYVTAPQPKLSLTDSYYATVRGTSFASPHVAGAAALLLQWIRDQNITIINNYTIPSLVKTSLMRTAKSLDYPDTVEGAGLINVGMAWHLLKTKYVNGEDPPRILYALPKKLPAGLSFPWKENLFRGMRIEFNETIYTTFEATLEIGIVGNVSLILKNLTLDISPPFFNWEIVIKVPTNTTIGYYNGSITFYIDDDEIFSIPIEFSVLEPIGFILFDLRHTSWIMDSKYGQYRHYFELAESLGFAVEQYYWTDPEFNITFLSRYDLVFMPDVSSYYTIYDANGTDLGLDSKFITENELAALHQYVSSGGGLIFVSMIPVFEDSGNNITNVNEFSSQYGVKFNSKVITSDSPVVSTVLSEPYFGLGGEKLPFFGCYIDISSSSKVLPLIKVETFTRDYITAGLYFDLSGGFIIFTATNFFFDNWAFEGDYRTSSSESDYVKQFHEKIFSSIKIKRNVIIQAIDESPTLGDTVNVNITIIDLDFESFDVYYIDRLGSIKLENGLQIGPHSYKFSFVPRHARDVVISVHINTTIGKLVIVSKPIYINPTELNPPVLISIQPANETTIVENLLSTGYLTFNFTVEDDTEILLELVNIEVIVGEYELEPEIDITSSDNVTLFISIKIDKKDILNTMFFTSSVKLVIKIAIYDININVLNTKMVYTIQHKSEGGIFEVIAIVFLVLALVLVISIIWIYKRQQI